MKAAGYEKFGPFEITNTHTTEDVEDLIGAKWMLWVETRHFKIGSILGKQSLAYSEPEAARRLAGEIGRLRKKLPRIKKKPKELDEWLTLHLYAQRLEELYADISDRFNVKEEESSKGNGEEAEGNSGNYTGWKNKFVVLLFEQKGNLARYLARYTGLKRDNATRHIFSDSRIMLFATARQALASWPDLDTAFLCHITANMVHSLINSYGGYKYRIPLWWGEGLTHWYVRRIDPKFFNPTTAPGQKFDYRKDHEWEKKVYARIKNDYYRPARELLDVFDPKDMDFADHMMAWSRVDYLLTLGNEKAGKYMEIMNGLPWTSGTGNEQVIEVQKKALREAWNLDHDTLDKKWTAWVLKKYKNYKKASWR
jgi:hypothetical protein